MTQAVTELIVRGDGALATLDKFDDKMVAAGQATDRSTGAVARYNAAMAQMSAAQEKGLAITTQKVERQTAEQRAMERWQGTVDKTMQLEIRLRRDAQRAAVDTANAVALGYATQEQGLATLTKLEQIHAAQLAESAALSQRVAGVQGAVSGRYDAATAAINRQTNALKQNHSAGSFNTANIAAQFQDIGVTSAMGMSPIQIALQQGTQLSAVFEQMKTSGQSVGAGLRAAFMSVVSPMSLVTIGAIAVTAAVVQFAASLGGKANPEAKEFSKWLEKIGSDANTAAEFLERVNKAVHDLTVVDLNKLQRQGQAYIDQERAKLANPLAVAAGWEGALNDPKFVETYNLIDKVLGKLRSDDGFKNIDDLHKSMDKIVATRPDLQKLAEGWNDLGEAILKAKEASEQAAHQAELAMHGMQAYQGRDGAAMQKYLDQNVSTLRELKKAREAAFDQLYAKSPAELAAAARKNEESKPLNPSESPEVREYRILTAASLAYAQAMKQITEGNDDRVRSLDNSLASQRLENALIGAGVKQRASASLEFQQMMEIHDEAIRNGITGEKEFQEVYGDLIANIHERAQAYGEEAEAAAKANLEGNLAFERAQLGRTDVDQRVASQLRDLYGGDYQSHMNDALAGQIRYNEELKKTDDLAKDAFDTIIDALTSSGDLADNLIKAFAQIGKMFAQIGSQKLFDYITGKSSTLSGLSGLSSLANVGGSGVSVANAGREAGRAMAQPISDRFASVGEDLAANIHAAASTLGISARDLATVISYETGGTFSTSAANPDGKHIGLIQFGPEEQRKYGASIGQALSDQMQAVVGYLKDRGLKPGMDLLDLYSTINAGSPGRYSAVDGSTNVAQKVAGMAGHQATADRILGKQTVSDGMVDAERRISSSNFQNRFDTTGPTSVAGMSKTQGMLGVGGAAIGAFAGGYESGSPIMGGINGAMAGLGATSALSAMGLGAAAGPVGMIGGAIIGLIGGILGKAKQKREELKKAQEELESQIGAITNLMRTATGNYLGAMEKEFGDNVDEFQKAIALAEKAKNAKLANQLKDSMNEFFDKLVNDWNAAFEGTLDSLNAGLGMDGEFLKGMDAVEKMRESLIVLISTQK